ncbi:hypothetical protein BC826DRAFT_974202 [Russula brevipes]|nr:hypothetical protein BC826DRAFT_974202 [Russula brevipes]
MAPPDLDLASSLHSRRARNTQTEVENARSVADVCEHAGDGGGHGNTRGKRDARDEQEWEGRHNETRQHGSAVQKNEGERCARWHSAKDESRKKGKRRKRRKRRSAQWHEHKSRFEKVRGKGDLKWGERRVKKESDTGRVGVGGPRMVIGAVCTMRAANVSTKERSRM